MTSEAGRVAAHRLLAAVAAAMPPARREWGRAIAAELDHTGSRADQVRLVFGAARVALLPPPGAVTALAGYARAMRRAACLAVVAAAPLCLALYLVNGVFRAWHDSFPGDVAISAYLILILAAAGAMARRACPRAAVSVLAGIAAGLVLGGLETATFSVASPVYHPDPGLTIYVSALGVIFAPIGAAIAKESARLH
jgi:hypothetical protein